MKIKSLSLGYIREVNVARCEEVFHPLDDWTPTDWALAMIGEAGEVCNEVKKLKRGDGDVQRIASELADVILYIDLLAARLGINLSKAVFRKFNAVSRKRGASILMDEVALDG